MMTRTTRIWTTRTSATTRTRKVLKMTTRRTRTGSRLLLAVCLFAAVCLGAGKKKTEPDAIVAGTVFRDPGFSLPGAAVTLVPKANPKAKKQQAISDARG